MLLGHFIQVVFILPFYPSLSKKLLSPLPPPKISTLQYFFLFFSKMQALHGAFVSYYIYSAQL